jgi:hypothetical protein
MEKLLISIGLVAVIITALLWVSAISYMKENHPEYKAEDFLEDEEDK